MDYHQAHAQQSGNKCTWRDLNSPTSPRKFLVANEPWPEGRLEVGSYLPALYACNDWSVLRNVDRARHHYHGSTCVLSHFEVISAPAPRAHALCAGLMVCCPMYAAQVCPAAAIVTFFFFWFLIMIFPFYSTLFFFFFYFLYFSFLHCKWSKLGGEIKSSYFFFLLENFVVIL